MPAIITNTNARYQAAVCWARSSAVSIALSFLSACSMNQVVPFDVHPENSTAIAEISVAFAGDIMVHNRQLLSAYDNRRKDYDFKPMLAPARPLFEGIDLAVANLETTLPGKGFTGYPQFGSPDSLIDAIKYAGINVVTTANNHTIDKGKHGLVRTLKVLDEKQLRHLGTYASQQDYEQSRIFIFEQNGIRIAMLNYTYGTNMIATPDGVVVNRIEKELITEDLLRAREEVVDAVIVIYHFGAEYLNKPDQFQIEMVDHALRGGADIVLGGHPHHIQPYKLFRHGGTDRRITSNLVAYSVGNFLSGQRRRYTDGGMVLYFKLVKYRNKNGREFMHIDDVKHKLVWVYMRPRSGGNDFMVLPVDEHVDNGGPIRLTENARRNMRRFRRDAETVLNESYLVDPLLVMANRK